MTIGAVKNELHEYMEHASQSKIMAMYTLLHEESNEQELLYDEATLSMLEKRFENMISGVNKTLTLEQTIDNIRQYRKQYGI